ncbi:alpha/beta hydrolase [Clostridium aminobutyricum]|uniref:Alpha/beta hydrolase n=1 Tax=Clostridium aminobutyricum TaxID=33953 RepID=A0A939D793_CLOAM|nr:alpha/beta hydrolase [Clostridium aminobutyricum]MBN7772729.1 alpha/beta hydrolase [Clostridium aminobutyricum]
MPINKFERAILKAISHPSYDVKKRYRLERSLKKLKAPLLTPLYRSWDQKVFEGKREILTRVFTPKEDIPKHTIVFFHGGGWVTENIDSYNNICKNLSTYTKSKLISVEYRLAPEHPFPQGFEDCYAVAKQVHQIQAEIGNLPGKIILMGDSAGGNLAAAVALKARDKGEFNVEVQILLYPATYFDHSPSSPFDSIRENGTGYILTAKKICDYMTLYKSTDRDLFNPYFAPLMADDFSNQPRTLIISAEFDPLRDEGEEYGKKLIEAGNEVEIYRMQDALHGYMYLGPRYVHVKKTYDLINRFLNESEGHV